jgi:hypothetical protein
MISAATAMTKLEEKKSFSCKHLDKGCKIAYYHLNKPRTSATIVKENASRFSILKPPPM